MKINGMSKNLLPVSMGHMHLQAYISFPNPLFLHSYQHFFFFDILTLAKLGESFILVLLLK